jgi:hypothetical protein
VRTTLNPSRGNIAAPTQQENTYEETKVRRNDFVSGRGIGVWSSKHGLRGKRAAGRSEFSSQGANSDYRLGRSYAGLDAYFLTSKGPSIPRLQRKARSMALRWNLAVSCL